MVLAVPTQWVDSEGDQDSESVVNATPGGFLVAILANRTVDGSAPTLAVGDVSRNMWTLLSSDVRFASSPYQVSVSQFLQVEVWACPSERYDGWPWALVYASAMQITAPDVGSLVVDIIEVTGMSGQLTVDSVTIPAPVTAGNSITLTAPAPSGSANCLFVAAAVADIAYGSYTTTGTGWTQLNNATRSGPECGLFGAWREGTTGSSVTFSLAGGFFRNWAGVIVALRTSGTVISQPNPAWAATSLQIGLGYDLTTPLSRVRFTDQTNRYRALSSSRGIQAELGTAQQGQTTLVIRDDDGAYSPRPVATAASASAAGTTTTVKILDAGATSIHVADFFRLKTSVGALKELNVFQVTALSSSGGTTTVTFKRADGTAGGALAATASGDVYAGIPIDLYIPWRLLKTVAGTTYVVASGWLRDLPLTFTDAHWAEVSAAGADVIETLTAQNPSALRGEIYRRPGLYAYWPLDDASNVTYGVNQSGVSVAPLTQTNSKYGTGQMTAAFGASTQGVTIPNDPNAESLWGDAGSGWAQSGGVAADLSTKGYALVGSDPNMPPITTGVTIVGAMIATDITALAGASADPTVCILRNSDPAAGIGQGSVIKVSVDRPTLRARVTVWDKTTHATTGTLCGPTQIASGGGWTLWVLTFDQSSWALYHGGALVGSGSCNLVASWSGINVGGEADQFNHGRFFSAIHAHIAVYGRRLTAQEATNLSDVATQGTPLSEPSNARVSRKLNTVGWRGTRIANTSTILDSIEDAPSGTVVDLLNAVASWEDSAVFADAANQLQYRNRITAYQQRPRAVLGDGPGEVPFQPGQVYDYNPTFIYGQTQVTNTQVSSGNVGSSTFVAVDDAAGRYGARSLTLATRLFRDSDAWHLGWWLLARYATARQRVGTVIVSAAAAADVASSSGRWAFVCGVEVGDIVTVNRRPIGQPMISIRCRVLSVSLTFDRRPDPVVATAALTLAAAPFVVPIANDATYGTVGGTVLGA